MIFLRKIIVNFELSIKFIEMSNYYIKIFDFLLTLNVLM